MAQIFWASKSGSAPDFCDPLSTVLVLKKIFPEVGRLGLAF
jgi:hypothetical protein